MREIRRRNPHIKNTDGMSALDDVNEQELAKDSGGSAIPRERNTDGAQLSKGQEKKQTGEINVPLPLKVEQKEKRIVEASSPKQKESESEPEQEQAPPRSEQDATEEREDEPKERRTGGLYVAFIALCALLSVAVVLYAVFYVPEEQTPVGETPAVDQAPVVNDDASTDPRPLYDRIANLAVTVRTRTDDGTRISSGTVVFSDGYVATLWDIVGSAERIEVILRSGEICEATLVGGSSLSELALLKIEASVPETIATANDVQIGDTVYAVGAMGNSAYASLSSSLGKGSVSFEARNLRVDEGNTQKFIKAMQLDGFNTDSLGGCPVFNENGEMIAIMVNIGADSASFALPIEEAMSVLASIKAGQTPTDEAVAALAYPCPRLGVECETVEDGVKIAMFSTENVDAAKKLKINDVIVKVGEIKVADVDALRAEIEKHRVGDSVEVFVKRYDQILSFYVELSA